MRIRLLLSLTFAFLLAAAPGFAQADLEANVPFDFHAGSKVMTAGRYEVDIDNAGILRIVRNDGRLVSAVTSIGVGGGSFDHESKLVFHRYGGQYFLAEIWVASRESGRRVNRTPREDALAQNAAGADVTILASLR